MTRKTASFWPLNLVLFSVAAKLFIGIWVELKSSSIWNAAISSWFQFVVGIYKNVSVTIKCKQKMPVKIHFPIILEFLLAVIWTDDFPGSRTFYAFNELANKTQIELNENYIK